MIRGVLFSVIISSVLTLYNLKTVDSDMRNQLAVILSEMMCSQGYTLCDLTAHNWQI